MNLETFESLKYKGPVAFFMLLWFYKSYRFLRYDLISDEIYLKKKFPKSQGYDLNLENPKSLNEKMQWLKINDRREISIQLADKYGVRDFIEKHFGADYLVPLLYHTKNVNSIRPQNLPEEPFIIKVNHDSGNYQIVRNKADIDWAKLRIDIRWWLATNYFYHDREWQYKQIRPRVIIEKLLLNREGKIPNDYKLHCINGKVAFIYVSVDREGSNKRNIYDRNWKPLAFTFASKPKQEKGNIRGQEIEPPPSYKQMITFAEKIAQLYTYIRVDFYDVDGKLYFGEITHHHGGGFDQFRPVEWDYYFGEKLDLYQPVLDNL